MGEGVDTTQSPVTRRINIRNPVSKMALSSSQRGATTSEEEDANDFCFMTTQERNQLESKFAIYDTVGDGKININVLGETLRACGRNPTESEVRNITKELDSPFTNRVSFEEFIPIYQSLENREKMSKRWNKDQCAADCASALRTFDQDLSGKISTMELYEALTTKGEVISQEDANLLISEFVDQEGEVDIEEFVKGVIFHKPE